MNFLVTSTLDRKYFRPGTLMIDPYTEDRDGHLYLTDASGKRSILCEAIVDIVVDAPTPPAAPTEPSPRHGDEWLTWAAKHSPSKGEQRTAHMLSAVPFEQRGRAVALAHTIVNVTGMRYSDAMWDAVAELKRAGYAETVTEREVRLEREQQKELRDAKWIAQVTAATRKLEVTRCWKGIWNDDDSGEFRVLVIGEYCDLPDGHAGKCQARVTA